MPTARRLATPLPFPDNQEPPTFPLVNVPDHTLNEEDLKEKRRQRLMKAGYDARIRAKTEKDAEKLRVAEEARLDEEARQTDPVGWLEQLRQQHEVRLVRSKAGAAVANRWEYRTSCSK